MAGSMRAVVFDRYGPPDVLRIEQVERPVPADDEVLVKVRATTVNRLDCHTREANRSGGAGVMILSRLIYGIRGPRRRILGTEFAGEVEAVGAQVTEFKVGDTVFGNTGLRFGAHAEYLCQPQSKLITHMPAGTNFDVAAPITDGALNALWCLKHVDLRDRSLLVYGASGAIGTACVQLARHFGAAVTGVCATKNLELVRSLGADRALDYTNEDFTKTGETYDAILDAAGRLSFRECEASLKPSGNYLATDGLTNFLLSRWTRLVGGKRVWFEIPPRFTKEDIVFLKELVETGKFRPVIDRRYALDEVIEASRYVETRQKTGNVVLTVS
jgi:NADPH:quinone reductase-like Zn-dependent oxidoreductase